MSDKLKTPFQKIMHANVFIEPEATAVLLIVQWRAAGLQCRVMGCRNTSTEFELVFMTKGKEQNKCILYIFLIFLFPKDIINYFISVI